MKGRGPNEEILGGILEVIPDEIFERCPEKISEVMSAELPEEIPKNLEVIPGGISKEVVLNML